jgi:hypothetical protein
MIKIPHTYNFEWDYEGWRKLGHSSPFTQKDWNQTLITRINQVSNNIHKASLRGGGDRIRCNKKSNKLLKTLEYYNQGKDSANINNRYLIEIDELVKDNEIYIYSSKITEKPFLIPKIKETEDSGYVYYNAISLETETTLGEISLEIETNKNKKQGQKYRKKLVGKITILNYEG